ncbi:MAG: beta galactosidase jelly roll domain-containing protein, partial [Anaerolineae bacterium]|nr:beta galactosidase jelly roll domain-containing protein [Anaerolineae bacterium]
VEASDTTLYSDRTLDVSQWPQMVVPSNWYPEGLDHHGVVWFRHEFDMPPNEACAVWWLEFGGVDYACDVWVNGTYLGHHTGYFGKFRFDVTQAVSMGSNTLVVRVNSPFEEVGPHGWSLYKKLIKGVLNHHDCRPGGAWSEEGQSQNTGGIWQDVMLQPYDCDSPPQADDWYLPLAKPRVQVDPLTLKWRQGSQPFFPRGTNYIPNQFLSRMTRDDFERDLRLMKNAHLNAVRVHAHVLPDVFYELCDEMEMVVWQDFPLQWGTQTSLNFMLKPCGRLKKWCGS